MTYYGPDDLLGLAGSTFFGDDPMGVLAEDVPSEGLDGPSYIYPALQMPADTGKRVRAPITQQPSGTLTVDDLGRFTYTGAPSFALYLLVVDDVASTVDIGYGPGIGRLNLDTSGSGGGTLSGTITPDPALAGGSMGSGQGSVLAGDAGLEPVGVGGGFDSAPPGSMGGDVPLAPVEIDGNLSGDVSGVLPTLTPGRRVIYAGRQVPQKLPVLDVHEVDNLTADFSTVFPPTEPVIQCEVSCEVRLGTDPRPVPLLFGNPQIQGGLMVRQRIQGSLGLEGVTYLVRVAALAASGRWAVVAGFIKVTRMG